MSKLYIANCTAQRQSFMYRLPETSGSGEMGGMRVQDIEMGQQIVLSGDLNKFQIDSVVQQHAKYGLIAVDEVDRTRGFTGMCYSVDKPVPVSKLLYVIDGNRKALDLRGKQMRTEAAVAVNQQVENTMSDQLKKLEIEVKEERSGNGPEHEPIEERMRVTRDEDPTPQRREKRGRR